MLGLLSLVRSAKASPKIVKLYRGSTLYPESKLISRAGQGQKQESGSWHSPNINTAKLYSLRPSKGYQTDDGKAYRMGFNPSNPGVIRRVNLDADTADKYTNNFSGYYNLPKEETDKGVISLIPTLMQRYKHPLFKGPMFMRNYGDMTGQSRIFAQREQMALLKVLMEILKSKQKVRLFNRGGIAQSVL